MGNPRFSHLLSIFSLFTASCFAYLHFVPLLFNRKNLWLPGQLGLLLKIKFDEGRGEGGLAGECKQINCCANLTAGHWLGSGGSQRAYVSWGVNFPVVRGFLLSFWDFMSNYTTPSPGSIQSKALWWLSSVKHHKISFSFFGREEFFAQSIHLMEKENQVQRQQSDSMMESLRKHLSTAEAETKKLKMQQEHDRLVVNFRWICGVVYLLSARYSSSSFFLVSPWWVLCQQQLNFVIFKGQYFATLFKFFENLSKLSQLIFRFTKFSQFFANCKKARIIFFTKISYNKVSVKLEKLLRSIALHQYGHQYSYYNVHTVHACIYI